MWNLNIVYIYSDANTYSNEDTENQDGSEIETSSVEDYSSGPSYPAETSSNDQVSYINEGIKLLKLWNCSNLINSLLESYKSENYIFLVSQNFSRKFIMHVRLKYGNKKI